MISLALKLFERIDDATAEFTQFLSLRKVQVSFLIFFSILLFLGRINEIGLANDADAWYAQKAWEMLQTGSWMVVYYLGLPNFINPPFPIWLEAISLWLFGGGSAYAAVLPSALLGIGTVYLTYRLAERLFGNRWVGFMSALILLFPGFYLDNARRAQVDAPLTFLILAVLYCGLKAEKNPRWFLAGGIGTGLALLTKSILGFFPLIILFFYYLFTGQGKRMVGGYALLGVGLAFGIGGSWFAVNYFKFGDAFIQKHLLENLVGRSQTTNTHWYLLGYLDQL